MSNALNSPIETSGTTQMFKVKHMLKVLLNQGDEKSSSEVSHRSRLCTAGERLSLRFGSGTQLLLNMLHLCGHLI